MIANIYNMPQRKRRGKGSTLSKVHKVVKDNKLISRGLALVPGMPAVVPQVVSTLGYGKRKKGGADLKKIAQKTNEVLKETKVISTALKKAGHENLAGMAVKLGYGRKKKGGSIFGDILSSAASIPAGMVTGATIGTLTALKGLGRKKKGGIIGNDFYNPYGRILGGAMFAPRSVMRKPNMVLY